MTTENYWSPNAPVMTPIGVQYMYSWHPTAGPWVQTLDVSGKINTWHKDVLSEVVGQPQPDLAKELEEVKQELKKLKDTVYGLQKWVRDIASVTTRAR